MISKFNNFIKDIESKGCTIYNSDDTYMYVYVQRNSEFDNANVINEYKQIVYNLFKLKLKIKIQ